MSRRPMLVVALVGVLASVLWWTAVASPQRADLADARADRDAATREHRVLAAQLAHANGQDSDAQARLATQLDELAVAVPDEVGLADLLRTLGVAAADAGLTVVSIQPEEPEAAAGDLAASGVALADDGSVVDGSAGATATAPLAVPIHLEVQGELPAVLDLLAAVRAAPRVVVVHAVSMTPLDAAGGTGLDVTIGAVAFVAATPAG